MPPQKSQHKNKWLTQCPVTLTFMRRAAFKIMTIASEYHMQWLNIAHISTDVRKNTRMYTITTSTQCSSGDPNQWD